MQIECRPATAADTLEGTKGWRYNINQKETPRDCEVTQDMWQSEQRLPNRTATELHGGWFLHNNAASTTSGHASGFLQPTYWLEGRSQLKLQCP